METVKFDDWKKLNLKVGEIKEVDSHPNADKLYFLKVDIGDKIINLVAGIKNYYAPEDLIGRKIIVFTNLEPAIIGVLKARACCWLLKTPIIMWFLYYALIQM